MVVPYLLLRFCDFIFRIFGIIVVVIEGARIAGITITEALHVSSPTLRVKIIYELQTFSEKNTRLSTIKKIFS